MGLQLRMTHSLGQRLVEVEARSAAQAIVVGRAANAEVQIPSANISKRHCLLFVHDGRWVVQDAASPSGTFLNGERLTEPAFINSGDVISLGRGSNPPTLTVDPHSVGVTEEQDEPAPAARVSAARPVQSQGQQSSVPGAASLAGQMPPPLLPAQSPQSASFGHGDEGDNFFGAPAAAAQFYGPPGSYSPPGSVPGYGMPSAPPVDEWAAATEPSRPRRRVARPKGNSGATIAITAVLAVVIVVGGGALIYHNFPKPSQVKIINDPPPAQTHQPGSIFEESPGKPRPEKSGAAQASPAVATADGGAMDKAAAVRAVPRISPRPASAATETDAAMEKRREDPEWDAVERARSQNEPVLAIVKYYDYMERFPQNSNEKMIDQYTDQALDLIWWKRLNDLFAEREEAQKQIAGRKLDLSQSQDAEFKKMLEKEMAQFAQTRDSIDGIIHDQMKFSGQSPPNLYDASELAIARKSRDEKYYEETWKPQVLKTILSSHGQRLPWKSSQ
jgi:pSer/pThr/pTyr-binding forkhead associated (FHA) protein